MVKIMYVLFIVFILPQYFLVKNDQLLQVYTSQKIAKHLYVI